MKKSILVLFVTLALCLTIIPVSAITKSDKPITGGNTVFGQVKCGNGITLLSHVNSILTLTAAYIQNLFIRRRRT